MESHVCVFSTVIDLLNAGQQLFVTSDLMAILDPNDRTAALARMQAAGAVIVTIEMVLFERSGKQAMRVLEAYCS